MRSGWGILTSGRASGCKKFFTPTIPPPPDNWNRPQGILISHDWTPSTTWPRTVLRGGWCPYTALCTPSGACLKRRRRTIPQALVELTRMWANAQHDGRPAKQVVLCSTLQFGWRPLLDCDAVTLPRRETRWNLQGCPKLANRSQPLVGQSSPYYEDMCCCLTSFFPIVDACLSCEDTARQSCAMVPKWWFFASCICSEPRAAHFRHAF